MKMSKKDRAETLIKEANMIKIITIENCEDCKFVWLYLGVDERCNLMNRKPIPIDDDIPIWCPLRDASQEIIEAEIQLTKNAGIN